MHHQSLMHIFARTRTVRPARFRQTWNAALVLSALSLVPACPSQRSSSSSGESPTGAKRSNASGPSARPSDPLIAGARGAPGAPGAHTTTDAPPLPVLGAAVLAIGERYVAPTRISPAKMFDRALEYVEAERPEILVKGHATQGKVVVQVGAARRGFALARLTSTSLLYTELKRVLGWIRAQVRAQQKDVEPKELADLSYAAVNGICSTLDPHSVLMPPRVYGEMRIRTRGAFGGIGIVISIRDGALTVISPIDGTPAARAGIRAGDRITRIEDESTVNMPLGDAVSRLRGKAGTPVAFWVEREGWTQPRRFQVVRERIEIKSVASRVLPGRVGYLRISRFSRNTTPEVTAALARLKRAKVKGIILDLWNNPGGLLQQAERVADLFLSSGDIVITEAAHHVVVHVEKATAPTTRFRGPVVVLLNRGSASAAEIVAGALKNQGRALVLGETSYGKGTVQMLFENQDNSALKLTVAQYLTPGSISIQGVGIVPDIMTNEVVIRKKWTRMFGHEVDARRRAKRKDLLPARTQHQQRPRLRVDYLSPASDVLRGGRRKQPNAPRYSAGENAAAEAVVGLARQILARHAGPREPMLRAAQPLVSTWGQAQTRRIVRALRARHVDWRPAPKTALTVAGSNLRAEVRVEPKADVVAGQTAQLVVQIWNQSTAPIYRLRGRTLSPSYFLNELELLFGAVPPGAKRTLRIPIRMPSHLRTSVQPVEVRLQSPTLDQQVVVRARVRVRGLPRPRFVLSYRLHDDVKGNGNGRPERGETIRLQVGIRDVGSGPVNDGLVAIRNLTGHGLFVEKGRASIRHLAPGGSRSVNLTFRIEPTLKRGPIRIELSAYDARVRAALVQKLRIPLAPASATAPGLVGVLSPPVVTLHRVPLVVAPGTGLLRLGGVATDAHPLRDLYVEVTNFDAAQIRQKVYYRSVTGGELSDLPDNLSRSAARTPPRPSAPRPASRRAAATQPTRPGVHQLPFRADVPLWKGLNEILVVVRGAGGVLGLRRLVVLRPQGGAQR